MTDINDLNDIVFVADRTLADEARTELLAKKWAMKTITVAEKSEWFGEMKGAYGVLTLNRVGNIIKIVADLLNAAGANVSVTAKTDWSEADYVEDGSFDAYLADVAEIHGALAVMDPLPNVPGDMVGLTTTDANAIEKILEGISKMIPKMYAAWFFSGDLYAGEV
mgnify:CR=1 FL=1